MPRYIIAQRSGSFLESMKSVSYTHLDVYKRQLLESGGRNITEQVIKSICREFNVDYIWLTTGDGEMFVDTDDDFIERDVYKRQTHT